MQLVSFLVSKHVLYTLGKAQESTVKTMEYHAAQSLMGRIYIHLLCGSTALRLIHESMAY